MIVPDERAMRAAHVTVKTQGLRSSLIAVICQIVRTLLPSAFKVNKFFLTGELGSTKALCPFFQKEYIYCIYICCIIMDGGGQGILRLAKEEKRVHQTTKLTQPKRSR